MDASHSESKSPLPPVPLSPRRFKLGVDPCAYCGTAPSTDREDPVPIGLYTPEARAKLQFLKIPSCRPCNLAKSKVDSELIAYLTINRESGWHPEAKRLFSDKVLRAVSNNHVRMVDHFASGIDVYDFDSSGAIQQVGYSWQGDASAILEAIRWIVRGLHWLAYDQSVKDEWSRSKMVEDEEVMKIASMFSLDHTKRTFSQGEVFTCALIGKPEDRHNETLWALSFFDSMLFLAATRAADLLTEESDKQPIPQV